jgi:hypothetical protein
VVLVVALLADSAYERVFSHINTPDDEGYLTVTLASFADGNALYDEVYSQYGPGYYTLVGGGMQLLGVDFTSDGARWVNLFFWLGSTLLAGVTLLRLTRSLAIAATGTVLSLFVLSADAFEPLHPGASTGFALLALLFALTLYPRWIRPALAAVGALAAVLISIKVNVGLLAAAAIVFACAASGGALRGVRWLSPAVGAGFVAVPFVLMAGKLDDPQTLRFAAVVGAGALALAIASLRPRPPARPNWGDLAWLAGGGLAVLALVSLVPFVRGTSPGGLLEGWFVDPVQHPDVAFASLTVDELGPLWALFGLVSATGATAALGDVGALGPRARAILGAGRLVFGLVSLLAVTGPFLGLPLELTRAIVICAPFAWMATIGRTDEVAEMRFVRIAIAAVAILQTLHAYPVPGAQLGWSEIAFVIVGGLCAADGIDDLAAAARMVSPRRVPWAAALGTLVAAFGIWVALDRVKPFTDAADASYSAGVPLGLPGTDRMRVAPERAEQLQDLTSGLRENCGALVTLPGMNSLHLYSGVPMLEEMSSTWMLYLDSDEQGEIVERARAEDRLCVIRKPDLLAFWAVYTQGRGIPDRPLVRFIRDEFQTLRNYSGYFLEVRAR